MKILHIPYTYYPDPVGGTELYVEQLAHALNARGIANIIAAPGPRADKYMHNTVHVYRIPTNDRITDLKELYGQGDTAAAEFVGTLLEQEQIDLLHLHALTRIVSPRLAEQARQRRIPVVFTYHTPTVSCVRGNLMLWGNEVCDGILETDRCTRCRLQSLGLSKPTAALLAQAPRVVRKMASSHQGGMWTALRMRALVQQQHETFLNMMTQADAIIALSMWTRKLLMQNHVPAEKIVMVPHGLPPAPATQPRPYNASGPVRLIALGRLDAAKGLDLPIVALLQQPGLNIHLDVYGIAQSENETAFARKWIERSARDTRVQFKPAVPHSEIIALLREYDALLVPSRGLETGPLVVLEAFAAGIPVIGSDLGGIADKVTHEIDGLLVSPTSAAWRKTLHRLATNRALLETLRANVRPPRSMQHVADEMCDVYNTVRAKQKTLPV